MSPDDFKTAALAWISALSFVLVALLGAGAVIWGKVTEVRAQIKAAQQKADSNEQRICQHDAQHAETQKQIVALAENKIP